MDKNKAEALASAAIRDLEGFGNQFKVGSFEVITQAFLKLKDPDRIASAIERVIIPRGIEMPWGIRVIP
jgi:hypothetical protein